MTISLYKTSVPIFVQFLTSLSAMLDKARPSPRQEGRSFGAADHPARARHVSAGAAGAGRDRPRAQCLRTAGRGRTADALEQRNHAFRSSRIASPRPSTSSRASSRRRSTAPKTRRSRSSSRAARREFTGQSLLLEQFAAELLFPLHHRLRHPAPLRGRARQARFHGNAGVAVSRSIAAIDRAKSARESGPDDAPTGRL